MPEEKSIYKLVNSIFSLECRFSVHSWASAMIWSELRPWFVLCNLRSHLSTFRASLHAFGQFTQGGIFRNNTDPRVKVTPSTSDGDWQFLVCGLQHSLQIDFMPPPKKRIQVRMFGALTSESVFLKMEALVGWLSSLWPENHAVFNLLARDRNGMGCEHKIRKKHFFF